VFPVMYCELSLRAPPCACAWPATMTNTHKASTRPHWGAMKKDVSQTSNVFECFWRRIDCRAILSADAADGRDTCSS
jgi:hypothetical protein